MSLRVPFAASSVAVARRQLKAWMTELGCSRDAVEDGRVVISELVGNSIRHAVPLPDGSLVIAWRAEPRGVVLSVTDGGSPTRPHKVNAPASALAGRGMAIVETLAQRWWTDHTRSGSTVYAVLATG